MTANPPLVSMVVATYNHADFLEETLESLLQQEYEHAELIVVDDGSTDGTAAILDRIRLRHHERVRTARHENAGQAQSLNRGFRMAHGDFVCLVNDDDPQPPGLLRPLVDALQAEPEIVLVYADWELIDDKGRYIHTVRTPEWSFVDLVRSFYCVPGPGTTFRRQLLERVGDWDPSYRYCPDFDWFLRAGLIGPFKRVPGVVARWRHHPRSLTAGYRGLPRARELMRLAEQFFQREDLPSEVQAVRAEAFRNAYITSAMILTDGADGPGSRFQIRDRLDLVHIDDDIKNGPASDEPVAVIERLHRDVSERDATISRLHGEVAARDRAVITLHAEVAERDKTVAWLHAEVGKRDRAIAEEG